MKQRNKNQCCGKCCERFTLPYSLTAIKRKSRLGRNPEFAKSAKILIPLGRSKTDSNGHKQLELSNWFTCKNFDVRSRLCLDYENRPNFCKEYGENGRCNYEGCPNNEADYILRRAQ